MDQVPARIGHGEIRSSHPSFLTSIERREVGTTEFCHVRVRLGGRVRPINKQSRNADPMRGARNREKAKKPPEDEKQSQSQAATG